MPMWLNAYEWVGDSPGARMRQARVARGLTLTDLANASGLSVRSIRLLEDNINKASLPNLRLLSKILCVPIPYLGCFESL
ncbi:MAG: helix-turn-helix domain-containing protein, partial [Bacillota bacterium]